MKKGYYVTAKGKRVELTVKTTINIPFTDIVELVIPDGVTYVHCHNNLLTELIIPDGVITLDCGNNNIRELILPESIITIWCENNPLTNLILPKGIVDVWCNIKAFDFTREYKKTNTITIDA